VCMLLEAFFPGEIQNPDGNPPNRSRRQARYRRGRKTASLRVR
jgi:hypothetical protein